MTWPTRTPALLAVPDRSCLPLPALRQGAAVPGLPRAAAALRGLRARFALRRCGRWPGGVHHSSLPASSWSAARSSSNSTIAAVLAACAAVAAADPGDDAGAAAADEGTDGRAAISPQGRRGPADAVHRERRAPASLLVPAGGARGAGRAAWARHLADRAQGLEGSPDRDAETAASTMRRSRCRLPRMGRDDAGQLGIHPRPRSLEFLPKKRALVFTSGSASATTSRAPGYFVFSPAQLADGQQVVINRGFVPSRAYPARIEAHRHRRAIRWAEAHPRS